jgi:hypothetical protein
MKKSPKLNIGDLVEKADTLYSNYYDCGIIYGKDLISKMDIEDWFVVFWLDTETTDVYPASQLRIVTKAISYGKKNKNLNSLYGLANWAPRKKG